MIYDPTVNSEKSVINSLDFACLYNEGLRDTICDTY